MHALVDGSTDAQLARLVTSRLLAQAPRCRQTGLANGTRTAVKICRVANHPLDGEDLQSG